MGIENLRAEKKTSVRAPISLDALRRAKDGAELRQVVNVETNGRAAKVKAQLNAQVFVDSKK